MGATASVEKAAKNLQQVQKIMDDPTLDSRQKKEALRKIYHKDDQAFLLLQFFDFKHTSVIICAVLLLMLYPLSKTFPLLQLLQLLFFPRTGENEPASSTHLPSIPEHG